MNDDLELPRLSWTEFRSRAMQKYLDVFNHPCSLTSLFTPMMDSRLVIYNQERSIDPRFLRSIIYASKDMGETGFYFSFVEATNYQIWYPGLLNDEKYLKTWFIPFENVIDYLAQTFLTHHVIYSQQGKWGVFVHDDNFLVLGGISSFTSQIVSQYPHLDQATDQFIKLWKEMNVSLKYPLEWIPDLLEHVYGTDKAQMFVQKHALPGTGS